MAQRKEQHMGEVKIRNVDDSVIAKLNLLAKKNGLKRETYIRKYLTSLSVIGELIELEDKYASLVKTVLETVDRNTEMMEQINYKLAQLEARDGTEEF